MSLFRLPYFCNSFMILLRERERERERERSNNIGLAIVSDVEPAFEWFSLCLYLHLYFFLLLEHLLGI